jgi:uncharacterized delta-60 repeat protein
MEAIIQKCVMAVLLIILITVHLGCSNSAKVKTVAEANDQTTSSSESGNLIWAKSAGGASGSAIGYGITTLSDNSSVVTGNFSGSATFGPGEPNQTILTAAGSNDIFIARYNPDGTLIWAKQAGGISGEYISDVGFGITTLSDNSTVMTGYFTDSATFGPGEPNQTVLTSAGNEDIFIASYNPDGTLAWAKRAGGASFDQGLGITALSDNSTVVTGYFSESATFESGETNQIILTSTGDRDIFIACYGPDGSLAWVKCVGGASASAGGYGITTLSDNSIVVTGYFERSVTFGHGESNQTIKTSAGRDDIFIARYNSNGSLVWVKCAGGQGASVLGYGITTLSDNSIVVTGQLYNLADFGLGEPNQVALSTGGDAEIFIARYNPDGTFAWARSICEASRSYAEGGYGITTLSDNSIIVTERFHESVTFGPVEPNETVLTSTGEEDIFIARYNPDGTLAWAKSTGGESWDWGCSITTISDDSVVLTGSFTKSVTFGPGEPNQTVLATAQDHNGFFIARFNP